MSSFDGDWLDELTPDDFPSQFQDLVSNIGVRATVTLAEKFGGLQFYVPKPDVLLSRQRNAMIKRDRAAGMDYRTLAQKYKLTEVWIRQIVDHQEDDRQTGFNF
jgi:Mor family transcriptional regulator